MLSKTCIFPSTTRVGDVRSNLCRLKSTPLGAPIILVAVRPAAARIGLAMRVAESPAAARIGPTDLAVATILVFSPVAAARIGLTPILAVITLRAARPAAAG